MSAAEERVVQEAPCDCCGDGPELVTQCPGCVWWLCFVCEELHGCAALEGELAARGLR